MEKEKLKVREELVYAIRITKQGKNDYHVDYPFEGMSISKGAGSFAEAVELAGSSVEGALYDIFEKGSRRPEFDLDAVSRLEKNKKENEFITFVSTSMETVLNKHGDGVVKRSVSFKQYQWHYIQKNNISLSKYVQGKVDEDIFAGRF